MSHKKISFYNSATARIERQNPIAGIIADQPLDYYRWNPIAGITAGTRRSGGETLEQLLELSAVCPSKSTNYCRLVPGITCAFSGLVVQ